VNRALGSDHRPPVSAAEAMSDSARRPVVLQPRDHAAPTPREASPPTLGPAIPDSLPSYWRTRAERTLWHETSDYDETMRYCRQLEAGTRWVKLVTYGTSGQGRDLPMLIVSRDRAFTPEAARATGKPIVLIQNGIHSGEIEGKDASLALVRDMTVLKTRESLLDSCIVLVLPIYSVDAHERHGRYNRINQNGPEEMGWRTTPIGLNLNRDYLKAEAPETRAMLAGVFTTWWPELLVDTHTTDGADYQHDVTYGFAHGPTVPAAIERWAEDAFEGRVVPRLAAMGHLPAPYLSFRNGSDPRGGIDFGSTPPRFSTGYAPLQGRAAILVETHMLKPYGDRVRATYDLLVALLEEVRAHPRALTNAVRDAGREIAGRVLSTTATGRTVALTSRTTDTAEPFRFRGKVTRWEPSAITGAPVPHYSDAAWDTTIALYRQMAPGLTVTEPAGYLVPREWPGVIELLQRHGVKVRRFARAWSDTVELARIADWSASAQPNEGHHPVQVKSVAFERHSRSYRPGDAWVPLDQRGALVAMHLCEAQAPDGLLAWNAFDTVLERKEYGEDYVVEPLATAMLAKDPKLAAEFQAKLAADSSFAANAWARSDFFYRRSSWADPEQNLLPIARALRPVPEAVLQPVPATPAR
jgi:murein tripeptide amidase MpaA